MARPRGRCARLGRLPDQGYRQQIVLAAALLAAEALPELAHGDYPTAASIADNLRRGGTASVQPITSALARVAEDAKRERHADQAPRSALVLLVDQFEELFAQRVSDDERAAFAESLRQLIATGRVWVVATLRADQRHSCGQKPTVTCCRVSQDLPHR